MRVFLIIVIVVNLKAQAQNSNAEIFSLKSAIGGNVCQVHGDSYSGFDKVSFFGGIAVNARLNERMSLELGFYYSQKGARHNPNEKTGDLSFYLLKLNYIDLPLSFRFMLNNKYFTTLGPSLAYLISYKENIDYSDVTGQYKFNNFEYGINIGLGRNIRDRFSVELRCSNSIASIRDYGVVSNVFYPNPVAQFFNEGFYNNILTLFFAYHLDLNKKR